MNFNMRIRARKIIVVAVAAALAVANGVAPRHAQAGMHPHVTPVASKAHQHDTGKTTHHHDAEAMEQAVAKALCYSDRQSNSQQSFLIHNCCVASCSAVAFIFASIDFGNPLPRADYGAVLPVTLTPASPTSADPPPR